MYNNEMHKNKDKSYKPNDLPIKNTVKNNSKILTNGRENPVKVYDSYLEI